MSYFFPYKTIIICLLFLCAVAAAAYTGSLYFLCFPFLAVAVFFLVQHPAVLWFALVASLPWSVEFSFSPSLGTDLPDEPFMLLASFSCWIMMIYHRKNLRQNRLHVLAAMVLLLWIWALLTSFMSVNPLVSFKYLLAKSWYISAFLLFPVVLFQQKKMISRSVLVLVISMTLSVALIMFRHASTGFTFATINHALEPFYRNHVNYSCLLVLMFPLLNGFLRHEPSKKIRILFQIIYAFLLLALCLSFARGAWLAWVMGLLTYWLMRKRLLVKSFIIFWVLVLAALLWLRRQDQYLAYAHDFKTTIFHTDFRDHLAATYQLKDMSTAERFYRWIAALRMTPDFWKTGSGPNTFYSQYKGYAVPAFKTWVSKNEEHSTVHNYFLLMLTEQGIMGMLLFIILLGSALWYAQHIFYRTKDPFWKTVTLTIGAMLVMITTVNFLSDMIETDKVGSVFYICLALLVMADNKTRNLNSAPHIEGIA